MVRIPRKVRINELRAIKTIMKINLGEGDGLLTMPFTKGLLVDPSIRVDLPTKNDVHSSQTAATTKPIQEELAPLG